MNSLTRGMSLALWIAIGAMGVAQPSRGDLVITPTFDTSITGDANAASIEGTIKAAIGIYESKFTNPININIKFQSMTTGLGQSQTSLYEMSYGDVYNRLAARTSTADEVASVKSLGGSGSLNPVTNSSELLIKTANLKALGYTQFAPTYDGIVGLNTHITDVGSPGTTGVYSLMAVVEHEIDEVLGLGSAVGSFTTPTPEDLFRYSAAGTRSFSTGGPQPYLSFNGGATSIVQYNARSTGDTGDYNGVGGPHVQDAFATPNAHPTLGVELRVLDVIGYNPTPSIAIPEPSSLLLLGAGGLMAALAHRRGRRPGVGFFPEPLSRRSPRP